MFYLASVTWAAGKQNDLGKQKIFNCLLGEYVTRS